MTGMATAVHSVTITVRKGLGTACAKFVESVRPDWRWSARGLALALLVGLSTPADGGYARPADSRPLQPTGPEAYFGQDDVPGEVLIGELFTFKVRFTNTGGTTAYAPFIDLAIDARGADYNAPWPSVPLPCDGIEFVSASMVDVNGGPLVLTSLTDWNAAACVNGSLPANVAHPYGAGPTSTVYLPQPGWQLVTMDLPFGSFDSTQPDIVVEVTAKLHEYADVSPPHPLNIYARGGFRSPTAVPGTPIVLLSEYPASDWDDATVFPTVFTVKKAYLGPEDEAVPGPNFIAYYPLKYTIVADIAEGQTIHNLQISDNLPAQLQFAGNVQVTILGAQAGPVNQCGAMATGFPVMISAPSTSTANGTLAVKLCDPITGLPQMTDEVVIEFEFYIPDSVLDADCDPSPVTVTNDVAARGDWDPNDPRDAPPGNTVPVFSDLTQDDHVLSAKCLAIQKSVEAPPGGPRPGDVLKYTLKFQVSDYHTIGQLLVTDVLGDGQVYLTTPPATLRVTDQFGTSGGPASIAFPPGTVSITPDVNAAAQRCGPKLQQPPGGTILEFNVSGAMALVPQNPPGIPRHTAGILTGGYATVPQPSYPPLTTAAEGEIVFFAKIRDWYAFPVSPGNPVVDKHDPVNNCVKITGDVLTNTAATTVPSSQVIGLAEDDSSTQTSIVTDNLWKSVYAIKRGTSFVCGQSSPAC